MRWVAAEAVAIEVVVQEIFGRRQVTEYGLLVFAPAQCRREAGTAIVVTSSVTFESYMRVLRRKVTGTCFHMAIGLPSLVPGTKRHRLASRSAESSSLA